jgi:hypothetical protein
MIPISILEVLISIIFIAEVSVIWIALGKIGRMMIEEMEDEIKGEYTMNFDMLDFPLEYVLGPLSIPVCIVLYFMNKYVECYDWINKRFQPKKKPGKPVNDQWDR